MAKHPPIDQVARELAVSGQYRNFLELEVALIEQYGRRKVKKYGENPQTLQYLNDLCEAASPSERLAGHEAQDLE